MRSVYDLIIFFYLIKLLGDGMWIVKNNNNNNLGSIE